MDEHLVGFTVCRLFLIPIILKKSKINVGVQFPTWGFPGGRLPGPLESQSVKNCNTVYLSK